MSVSLIVETALQVEASINVETDEVLKNLMKNRVGKVLADLVTEIQILETINPRTAEVICNGLTMDSRLDQLKAACDDGTARQLTGVGPKAIETILELIKNPPKAPEDTIAVSAHTLVNTAAASDLEQRMDAAFKPGIDVTQFQDAVNPTAEETTRYNELFQKKYDIEFADNGGIILHLK